MSLTFVTSHRLAAPRLAPTQHHVHDAEELPRGSHQGDPPPEPRCELLVGAGHRTVGRGRTWLGIAETTVKAHLTSVFQTIGVADRTQAVLWAERRGLLSSG